MSRKSSDREWDGRTVRLYYMGRQYSIPIDDDGYVPVEAMVMRFQECGNDGRDRSRDSAIIYPSRARPKDILRWWADPSSCDIEGVDTKRSRVYDVSGVRGKEMRRVQRRIGIVTLLTRRSSRPMLLEVMTDAATDNDVIDAYFSSLSL